ncbi:MAG: hypothetical protein EOM24_10710 [Chloroflexia bacterium]|nr:hypothetical protein [Chloroflexia bacterium]
MYAVEFHTRVKQDGTIDIPDAYRDRLKGDLRVIILTRDTTPERDMIQYLLDHPLYAPDFQPMSRDDMYRDRMK